jgi:phospholipid/cholesterol/gamma-HCH transport system permease protein
MNPLRLVGRAVLGTCETVGELSMFGVRALAAGIAGPYYPRQILRQLLDIGYYSLPVVGLTAIFTGMVLALQSFTGFSRFQAESAIPTIVIVSLTRELGPVLAGLMVAGRVGSGIAAQLGSMKVTEQIDALNTLGTDPIKKLVTPRVLAALIMLPILTIINDFVGILGGSLISSVLVGVPTGYYWRTVWEQIASDGFVLRFIPTDFVQGLVKPFVFGGIISITACYFGINTTGGTEGVGQSTTRTVVMSSILILVIDYFLTQILLSVLGA